jgi:hypothetical protein
MTTKSATTKTTHRIRPSDLSRISSSRLGGIPSRSSVPAGSCRKCRADASPYTRAESIVGRTVELRTAALCSVVQPAGQRRQSIPGSQPRAWKPLIIRRTAATIGLPLLPFWGTQRPGVRPRFLAAGSIIPRFCRHDNAESPAAALILPAPAAIMHPKDCPAMSSRSES